MRDLGAVFREFREAGNFSLKEVAGDICSTSQLSRFELGESDLSVTKFLALLEQIHVPVASFLDKARDFRHEERIKLMSKLNQLYYELNVILLQGLICQRNPQYSMDQADLDKVADYLFQVEDWTMYELILFGNLYSFFDVDYVYRMGKEVLERESFYAIINKHRELVIIIALNCCLHCLESKAFAYADFFENYTAKILGKDIKLYERTIFLYVQGFSRYQRGDKQAGMEQMQDAMGIFARVGLDEQVDYYQEHFNKFVK